MVDAYIERAVLWHDEMLALQEVLLACNLVEELKWGVPCYTYKGTNIILIGAFKNFCNLSFIKGALLRDEKGLLVSPGKNSRSARYLKFTNVSEIDRDKDLIKAYIFEAIDLEDKGLKVPKLNLEQLELVNELEVKMSEDAVFKNAFQALTPGRRRAYNMFFGEAKQAKTRTARIEKYAKRILDGYGMNDCVCGHSKRMPNCDGSHKYL